MQSLYNDIKFNGMKIAILGGNHEIHCLGCLLQLYME